eukprot:12371112-Prorocentrum_lima.AAC.1
MTSSLVGSEMCIRDRQPLRHQQRWAGPFWSAICSAVANMCCQLVNTAPSCLLYTSDAADDM